MRRERWQVWVSTAEGYEAAVCTVWVSTGLLENEMGARESKSDKLEPKVWTETKGVHERRKDEDNGELNKNDWMENGVPYGDENDVINGMRTALVMG